MFLDRLYWAAEFTDFWQKSQQTPRQMPEPHLTRAEKFTKAGIGEKFTKLQNQFGITIQYQTEIESVKAVRNCLTHRMGIVGAKQGQRVLIAL